MYGVSNYRLSKYIYLTLNVINKSKLPKHSKYLGIKYQPLEI